MGDAAGVVGHGAVGVHGQLDAGVGQHTHCGNRDAVQAGKVMRAEDGRREKQNWQHRRAHAHAEAGNDVGGRAALGRLPGNFHHRFLVEASVILGDKSDAQPAEEANQTGVENAHGGVGAHYAIFVFDFPLGGQQVRDEKITTHEHNARCGEFAARKAGLGITAFFDRHEHHANHRSHDADGREAQGQHHHAEGANAVRKILKFRQPHQHRAEYHRADHRAHVAFEQIRAHAGDVAHVVAHVVGDGGGVERMILRDARFHLAHKIRAHVGGLGVNATAHTGKERDRRSSKAEACQYSDCLAHRPPI